MKTLRNGLMALVALGGISAATADPAIIARDAITGFLDASNYTWRDTWTLHPRGSGLTVFGRTRRDGTLSAVCNAADHNFPLAIAGGRKVVWFDGTWHLAEELRPTFMSPATSGLAGIAGHAGRAVVVADVLRLAGSDEARRRMVAWSLLQLKEEELKPDAVLRRIASSLRNWRVEEDMIVADFDPEAAAALMPRSVASTTRLPPAGPVAWNARGEVRFRVEHGALRSIAILVEGDRAPVSKWRPPAGVPSAIIRVERVFDLSEAGTSEVRLPAEAAAKLGVVEFPG